MVFKTVPEGYVRVTKLTSSGLYDGDNHARVYNARTAKNVYGTCIPFCSLKSAISEFYLLEQEQFFTKHRGMLTVRHEPYYTKKLRDLSLTILRFTIAASLGESRHFINSTTSWRNYEEQGHITASWINSYRRKYEKAERYVRMLFGGIGYSEVLRERNVVYLSFVPESYWLRYLGALSYVFKGLRWSPSMGGKKWGNGCDQGIRLYRALAIGEFKDVAIQLDTLINTMHNGGLLLNKFECDQCTGIQTLLDHKSAGNDITLRKVIKGTPCSKWGIHCKKGVRIKPITKGGINGKTKEEKIKGQYEKLVGESSGTNVTQELLHTVGTASSQGEEGLGDL